MIATGQIVFLNLNGNLDIHKGLKDVFDSYGIDCPDNPEDLNGLPVEIVYIDKDEISVSYEGVEFNVNKEEIKEVA